MTDAVRWLTYDEIAAELNIERESARQLAIRKRWARRRGNDNKARVGVPEEELQARTADAPSAPTASDPSDGTGQDPSVIQVLTRHISRLEAELETVKKERKDECERFEGQAEALEEKIVMLEQDLAAERLRAAQLETLKSVMDDLKTERDRWANAAEASQQHLNRVIESAKVEQRRSWWPFRRAG